MVKAMPAFIRFLPEYHQIIYPQNILLSNAVNILCKEDDGTSFQGYLKSLKKAIGYSHHLGMTSYSFTMNMDFMESNYKMSEVRLRRVKETFIYLWLWEDPEIGLSLLCLIKNKLW